MELEDTNKVYELIINNKPLILTYISDWLHRSFGIDYDEVLDIAYLSIINYPCYKKYCLKYNTISNIIYLKTAITRYLGYKEGNLKAKALHNNNFWGKSIIYFGDEFDIVLEQNQEEKDELDTSSLNQYIYKKNILKFLKNQKKMTKFNKKAIYLYLTTDMTQSDVDRALKKPIGYTNMAIKQNKKIIRDKLSYELF